MRRDNVQQILSYYHEKLDVQCNKRGISSPLTLDDINTAYIAMLPNTLAWNIIEVGFTIGEDDTDVINSMCDMTYALLEDVVELKHKGLLMDGKGCATSR